MSEQPTELDLLFAEGAAEEGAEAHEGEDGEEHPKRKRRRGSSHDKSIRDLNLTAMMDMMTILLVFLLKNYASTPENVQITDELQPPRSTAKIPMDVAVAITITKKGILVDDKLVVQLENGHPVGETGTETKPIAPLAELLDRKVADMKLIADRGGPEFEGKILVVADDKVPYLLLMRVLYTAGIAQFSQYKLVVRSMADNAVMHEGGAAAAGH